MSERALLIEVRLLDGRYHGAGDWPPAPFRLFQAMVAGAYGGRWRSEPAEDKDAAFRWLERLAPPHVAAPAKLAARAITYFVPNNDLDSVGGDPARVSEIRAGKTVRPILFDHEAPFLYAWPFDDGEPHARRVCTLAERLHTLGRGPDAAFARAEIVDWSEAEARLAAGAGAVARPAGPGDPERDPYCPVAGSLDSLKTRFEALVRRFEKQQEGRTTITLFRQPPKARFRTVAYDRAPARLLFELRPADNSRPFRPVPQEQAAKVATAVRDLAARRLTDELPDRAAEIERVVVGRNAGPADLARRVRIVPLPSIGFRHAEPSIRRVLVEIPPDCPIPEADITWAISGQALPEFDTVDSDGVLDETVLAPTGDDDMLRHYGFTRGRGWRRWHTVTPAALPEPRPRGRVSGGARAEDDRRAAAAVAQALRHAGIGARVAGIRVQKEPFHRKGERADRFSADRFEDRLRHVEVTFAGPVRGPLVIGDGRWLGLGVMAHASAEKPPAVHVFTLDAAGRPPLAHGEALAKALHRAVLSRVDEQLYGGGRNRLREPLPTFFTGHEKDGAPARSGRHRHLFFLADDADGDGRIDRLAVVSPHLADRSFERSREERLELEKNLRLLDAALAGLSVLRAGKAGAPRLSRAEELGDGDPLFGRARSWVSRAAYRPTRHPHRVSPEAAVRDDLLEECARRGLPRPEVEIVEVKTGPHGGLLARARLRFAAAVPGPLLLGRGSHYGAGLFGAEE